MILFLIGALGLGIILGAATVLYFLSKDSFEQELKDELDRYIDIHSHEIAEHFEEHGWGLGTRSIQEEILYDLFGMELESYIRTQILIKTDCKLTYHSNIGTMYTKKDGYYPIYMDNSTGEIKVIENADLDKSYIFNHRDEDGFTEIGFL